MRKLMIYMLIFCGATTIGLGQNSNLENAEVVIEKQSSFELPVMSRDYEKIDKIQRKNKKVPQQYNVTLINEEVADSLPQQLPAVLDQREEKKFYDKYIRAGFGNYITPYVELGINGNTNPNFDYGVKFYHKSSQEGAVGRKLSAESRNEFDAFATKYSDYGITNASINYNRQGTHFYGFTADPNMISQDSIKQIIQSIGFDVSHEIPSYLTGNDLSFKGGLLFDYTFDHYNANEVELGLQLEGDYQLNEDAKINAHLKGAYNQYNNKTLTDTEISQNRSWFKLGVNYQTFLDDIYIKAGLKLAYSGDTSQYDKGFYIYPDILVRYTISEDELAAFFKVDGDLELVNYNNVTSMNPWVNNNLNLLHEDKAINIQLGAEANLSDEIGVKGSIGYALSNNMGFLINSPTDVSRFEMVYATNDKTGNFKIDLEGMWSKREWEVIAQARLNAYNVQDTLIGKAYHRPISENTISVKYKYLSNWKFGAVVYNKIGIKAVEFDPQTGARNEINLPVIFDLNLTAQYQFNENLSAFGLVNNLFSQKYQEYYRYNVRGFQLMAGVSYKF
ncbi:hypothetical protein KMW28_09595 [Flammeovirga yaeyamensis]|uniref:TonB-dependent receptor n=1 Tax=Flammeovirga yaeyamensis TaxID=367791 RepID=A0AAX1N8D0_9BACT|nr:TonB-dependent receptor [Flammeovirga yaeyamensis]MBB3698790.1 hypothetical protein [Flammeovirga yaeyamensis]NMF37375.1 TonB-dependent receptor [Flammeovirga yaeyamensis]QWG03809.1 hypothetical protein KMW28_09595 [Flammeovirga yaeyamensis]